MSRMRQPPGVTDKRPLLCCVLMLLFLPCPFIAQEPSRRHRVNDHVKDEPFATFELMDHGMSNLLELNHSLGRSRKGQHEVIDQMIATLSQIEQFATALKRSCSEKQEPFGERMFGNLQAKANATREILRRSSSRPGKFPQVVDRSALDSSIVDLVLQFQAATDGFKAVRCNARQLACCEPRAVTELGEKGLASCAWTCVEELTRCTGYSGPEQVSR